VFLFPVIEHTFLMGFETYLHPLVKHNLILVFCQHQQTPSSCSVWFSITKDSQAGHTYVVMATFDVCACLFMCVSVSVCVCVCVCVHPLYSWRMAGTVDVVSRCRNVGHVSHTHTLTRTHTHTHTHTQDNQQNKGTLGRIGAMCVQVCVFKNGNC